jgi:hypothetical protein
LLIRFFDQGNCYFVSEEQHGVVSIWWICTLKYGLGSSGEPCSALHKSNPNRAYFVSAVGALQLLFQR